MRTYSAIYVAISVLRVDCVSRGTAHSTAEVDPDGNIVVTPAETDTTAPDFSPGTKTWKDNEDLNFLAKQSSWLTWVPSFPGVPWGSSGESDADKDAPKPSPWSAWAPSAPSLPWGSSEAAQNRDTDGDALKKQSSWSAWMPSSPSIPYPQLWPRLVPNDLAETASEFTSIFKKNPARIPAAVVDSLLEKIANLIVHTVEASGMASEFGIDDDGDGAIDVPIKKRIFKAVKSLFSASFDITTFTQAAYHAFLYVVLAVILVLEIIFHDKLIILFQVIMLLYVVFMQLGVQTTTRILVFCASWVYAMLGFMLSSPNTSSIFVAAFVLRSWFKRPLKYTWKRLRVWLWQFGFVGPLKVAGDGLWDKVIPRASIQVITNEALMGKLQEIEAMLASPEGCASVHQGTELDASPSPVELFPSPVKSSFGKTL